MTYDVYRYIFYGSTALAAICLIVAVILFFALRIPYVIGDLTGANERKAVELIRNKNEQSGEKTYKSSAVNLARGKTTDRMTESGTLIKAPEVSTDGAMATSKLSTGKLETEALESYETSLLENAGSDETTILSASGGADETTILNASGGADETTILNMSGRADETTVLSMGDRVGMNTIQGADPVSDFTVEYEIILIHSDEFIA